MAVGEQVLDVNVPLRVRLGWDNSGSNLDESVVPYLNRCKGREASYNRFGSQPTPPVYEVGATVSTSFVWMRRRLFNGSL